MSEKKKHAKYGGSGAERYVNCPGSVALEAQIPKPESAGAAADKGTEAHSCLEFMLREYLAGRPALEIRKKAQRKFIHDLEMVNHCFDALEHVLETAPEHAEILIEEEVDASHFTMPGQWGSVDVAIVEEFHRLTIIDLKYGFGLVPAKDNLQLIYYALAASKKFHHNFAEIEVKIIQPRAPDSDGNTIRAHVYPIDEILKYEKIFKRAVTQAEGPDAPVKSGTWCKWCRAKPVCSKFREEATAKGALDFDEIPTKEETPTHLKKLESDLPRLLNAFPAMRDYMKAVESYAETLLEKGGRVEGYALRDTLSIRKWIPSAEREARKTWGEAAFTRPEPELLSPAQLEKTLTATYDKTAVKKWIDKRVTREVTGRELTKDKNDFSEITEKKRRKRK